MADSKNRPTKKSPLTGAEKNSSVTLKKLAKVLKLSPTTISLVLNSKPIADSIPQETQNRIFEAARRLNYRPNYIARSLRVKRTHTIGVMIPDLGRRFSSSILGGVEEKLLERDYFYFIGSHGYRPEAIARYKSFFLERCVEGILAIDTPQNQQSFLPVVSISGHDKTKGLTNIELNHQGAALQGVEHLVNLGHKRLAIIKGHDLSPETEVRCHSIVEAARKFGIRVESSLISELTGNDTSPNNGYRAAKKIIDTKIEFTALLCFNDTSAIGAIRALQEAGMRVPEDVSVLGFNDIDTAEFYNPPLTTIRQPLYEMGKLAAETLLDAIADPSGETVKTHTVEPELIIRQSTARVKE